MESVLEALTTCATALKKDGHTELEVLSIFNSLYHGGQTNQFEVGKMVHGLFNICTHCGIGLPNCNC